MQVTKTVTEWTLPGRECLCCGTVTIAGPPPGAHAGSVSYGPALSGAAILLTSYGNVPPERAAWVMGMLLGVPVSAGWVDKASARLSGRRCRAVTKLGPGGLQSWAGDVIEILREAHQAVEEARARGDTALDPEQLDKLHQRYDEAAAFGVIHNRLRDWHDGNHPGYTLALREYKEQVRLFTREFAVEWTSNSAERAVSGPKRHQAVSGYWHTLAPLVPHQKLPRLRRKPRPARPGRHPRRTRRKTLATATPRTGITPGIRQSREQFSLVKGL